MIPVKDGQVMKYEGVNENPSEYTIKPSDIQRAFKDAERCVEATICARRIIIEADECRGKITPLVKMTDSEIEGLYRDLNVYRKQQENMRNIQAAIEPFSLKPGFRLRNASDMVG
jgi:hypothetical protein